MNRVKKIIEDHWVLLIIFLTGFFIRLYGLVYFPLSHDELSVLERSMFSTIYDWWHFGVIVDTHPPLAHFITFFWIKLFGTSTISIKFPFFIVGVLTIPLSYKVGKNYLNRMSGLFLAACISTLQFPITYSLYARPYVLGLFILLALFYCWDNLCEKQNSRKYVLGILIFTVLASYNHYFSMLSAGILLLFGFYRVIQCRVYKKYMLAITVAGLLFLPYIPSLLSQFSQRGLDWLGPPRADFFWQYVKYIFHYSPVYFVFLLLILFFFFKDKVYRVDWRKNGFLFLLFFLPFIIGFLYSLYVKPVLQYSLLIFSFPFFILWISSFFPKFKTITANSVILCFLVLNVYTLSTRDFLITQQKHPFNSLGRVFNDQIKEKSDVLIFTSLNKNYCMYYIDSMHHPSIIDSFYNKKPTIHSWRNTLKLVSSQHIILSNIPKEYVSVAKEYFPNVFVHDQGYNYTLTGLSKIPSSTQVKDNSILFEKQILNSNDSGFIFLHSTDYGTSNEILLDSVLKTRHAILECEITFTSPNTCAGVMVLEIVQGDESKWFGADLIQFYDSNKLIQTAYLDIPMHLYFKNATEFKNHVIKTYLWNKDHCTFKVKQYSIKILADNRYEYGLFEDLE